MHTLDSLACAMPNGSNFSREAFQIQENLMLHLEVTSNLVSREADDSSVAL